MQGAQGRGPGHQGPGGRGPWWPRAPILAGGRCRGHKGEAQGTRGQGAMVVQGSHSSRGAGAGGPKGEAQGTRGQGAMLVQGPIPACGGDRESREEAQACGGRGSCGPPLPPPCGVSGCHGGGGGGKQRQLEGATGG